MRKDLNKLASSIQQKCEQFQIDLDINWVRRDQNKVADKLSRFVDLDDFGVSEKLVEMVSKSWGKCSVDRFATDKNTKFTRFNNKFCCPRSETIDAFAQNWEEDFNWLVPPPILVPETVRHLLLCKAKGVLITPAWKSARYWPLLFPCKQPAWFVKDFFEIPQGGQFIIPGEQPGSIFTPGRFKGKLLAVLLDATAQNTLKE